MSISLNEYKFLFNLCLGGENLPQESGVLLRVRHLEVECGSRAVHAGEQVQGGHRLLRAHRQEELRLHPQCVRHSPRQPMRLIYHDQVSTSSIWKISGENKSTLIFQV